MAKYLSLPFSDGTSLVFPHYDYKYCRKCTGCVWILSKSDNVQMFVSILSSLTVLFHQPLGFVCKTLIHLGNICMVSPQKVDTSYFDNSVPMHKNHMRLSLLSLIWLKGIVEQTICRGAQIYTDLSTSFVSKYFLSCVRIFGRGRPWCSLWWPGAGPLRYWTIE